MGVSMARKMGRLSPGAEDGVWGASRSFREKGIQKTCMWQVLRRDAGRNVASGLGERRSLLESSRNFQDFHAVAWRTAGLREPSPTPFGDEGSK